MESNGRSRLADSVIDLGPDEVRKLCCVHCGATLVIGFHPGIKAALNITCTKCYRGINLDGIARKPRWAGDGATTIRTQC